MRDIGLKGCLTRACARCRGIGAVAFRGEKEEERRMRVQGEVEGLYGVGIAQGWNEAELELVAERIQLRAL